MPISIGSNIAALQAQRKLSDSSARLASSFERLASGMRINRASDDAAGLAISSSLSASSKVLAQAVKNANDGISLLNVAQGALSNLSDIVTRQKELAEQAANGVMSLTQRKALHNEANALVNEFNRIVASTTFNGQAVINVQETAAGGTVLQIGLGTPGTLNLSPGSELDRTVGLGTYTESSYFQSNSSIATNSVKLVDVNGDGALDMLTAGPTAGDVNGETRLYLNDGSGSYSLSNTYNSNSDIAGGTTNALATGDLNGDGITDFVAVGDVQIPGADTGQARIFYGNGTGGFTTGVSLDTTSGPGNDGPYSYSKAVALADFNGDGRTDIAVSGSTALVPAAQRGVTRIFLNNGAGTFTNAGTYTSNSGTTTAYSTTVSAGDINNDGAIDLVVSGFENNGGAISGRTRVLLNNGSGAFTTAATFTSGGGGIGASVLADYNADGWLDLVAGVSGQAINLFLNDGSGAFGSARSIYTGLPSVSGLVASDMDGDGRTDIVLGGYLGIMGYGNVLLNNGDATFRSHGLFQMNYGTPNGSTYAVSVGDVNRDGVADLVASGYGTFGASQAQTRVFKAKTTNVSSMPALYLLTQQGAREALPLLEELLSRVTAESGNIGAMQSRLGSALSTVQAMGDNYSAAAARITDVDAAEEVAVMTRTQILSESAAAILAQANQSPALALTLLR